MAKGTPWTCFVIMQFGKKKDATGKVIDFNAVYSSIIKAPVEELGIKCVRCDEIAEAGWIHSKMFEHVYESDVAVVDITSLNPNVFYELGIRHALAKSVTVLLRRNGTEIPFNIQGFKVIDYDLDMASVDEAKNKIKAFVKNGLGKGKNDSPVHEVLNLRIGAQPKQLRKTTVFPYRLRKREGKQICLITGDLRDVKGIDVWVNSENSNMQMARHFDRSISSVIRYCGARKDKGGRVVEDTIAEELARVAGDHPDVAAGEIVVTGAGDLQRTHAVRKIFHASTATGQVGEGYTPIPNIGRCVRNAIDKADEPEQQSAKLKSILFPLIGTGTARGELEPKARELIEAAISHLESHPESTIDKVYFLNWSEQDLEVCQRVLQNAPEVVKGKRGAPMAPARGRRR